VKDRCPSGKVKVWLVGTCTGGTTGAVVGAAGTEGVGAWVVVGVGLAVGVADGVAVGVGVADALGVGVASVDVTVFAGAGVEVTVPKFAATSTPAVTAAAPSRSPPAIWALRRRRFSRDVTPASGLLSLYTVDPDRILCRASSPFGSVTGSIVSGSTAEIWFLIGSIVFRPPSSL
jgi:hypothetical protein